MSNSKLIHQRMMKIANYTTTINTDTQLIAQVDSGSNETRFASYRTTNLSLIRYTCRRCDVNGGVRWFAQNVHKNTFPLQNVCAHNFYYVVTI